MDNIEHKLPPLPSALKQEIIAHGHLAHIAAGEKILREGQFVKTIPLVLEGLVKVSSTYEDKELLLYYIAPAESCIMSFSAGLWNAPSKVFAVTEQETQVILLPVDMINKWVAMYPSLNRLFYQQFAQRYDDLLHTIHQLLFEKMDKRLYDFLKDKSEHLGKTRVDMRHHQIARELGTAREVVSRIMKKLEKEDKVRQDLRGIEIL